MAITNPNLCVVADFIEFFPHTINRAKVLRRSLEGAFVPYVRLSYRSEPLFSRSAVVNYFRKKFSEIDPNLVAAVEDQMLPARASTKKKARRNGR